MKLKYMTITHSEQSLLLQEAKRMVPGSKCCTGYVCTFPCKKGAGGEAFYYPSLPSSWSDISSAHPGSIRAQGLKRAPAIDPDQKPD